MDNFDDEIGFREICPQCGSSWSWEESEWDRCHSCGFSYESDDRSDDDYSHEYDEVWDEE